MSSEPPVPPLAEASISPLRVILPTPALSVTVPPVVLRDKELVLELIGPVVIPLRAERATAPPLLVGELELSVPALVSILAILLMSVMSPPGLIILPVVMA